MAKECAKMPVVNIGKDRLKKFIPNVKVDKVLEMLPFVGLDIEGMDGNIIRVEYNPNRPDFSSDYGIVRALRGLLGIETGMPRFRIAKGKSQYTIEVEEQQVKSVRPYIVALTAKNGRLDDESIKQLISMQEDLHNGIGRRRKKASIGIHALDTIHFPVTYKTVSRDYSFVPLGESSTRPIEQILKESEMGKQYGHILSGSDMHRYPIIVDSTGTTLSFPPIINGNITKVDTKCRNVFVEVTATDQKTAQDMLAIIAVTLYDIGFEIWPVRIGEKKVETPQMQPTKIIVSPDYINTILGLNLSVKQTVACLRNSRLDAKQTNGNKITCIIPRYRTDIIHPIDIAEEIAIGYGIYNFEPVFPVAAISGQKNLLSTYFDAVRETLIGLGMLESLNFSLTSSEVEYDFFGITPDNVLSVDSSKSIEHEILRESVIPSLLESLSHNVHEEYPQRLFEIGKTFHRRIEIQESWSVGAVIAYAEAGYTQIKSALQALLKTAFGKECTTKVSKNPFFLQGRCAEILVDGKMIGTIGEITPYALENFKLRVPVAAFEINLSIMTGIQ
jgi:phenylalanyl-tRNA synthetase beta chain